MEPLSTFAVACNIIQVLGVGCKLVVGAAERIQNGTELTNEHQELREVSVTIKTLCTGLEASFPSDPHAFKLSTDEHRLMEANKECLRLSKDFIELLDRLKVKERRAILESFKMSIKAYWCRDKIQAIQKALSQARDNLNFAFLLYMNSQQMANAEKTQYGIQSANHKLEGRIISMIESSSDQIQIELLKLAEELKDMYLDSDDRKLSDFLASNRDSMETLSRKIDSFCMSQQQKHNEASHHQESLTGQRILDSLQFPDMFQRVEQIPYAQRMTFQWMLHPIEGDHQQWSCFYSWLQTPESSQRIYWIQGKPGSGKSTLLKFLDENLDTNDHMSLWRGSSPVYKARFFFWKPGSVLQKSLNGFYRAILFEILRQRQDLMLIVIGAERWEMASLGKSLLTWKTSELRSILRRAIDIVCASAKLFLLIDGIDELDGNSDEEEQLLDFLLDLDAVENLKLCVSSRPWNVFRDEFGQFPQLQLEDLTWNDMVTTVTSMFQKSSRWKLFCTNHPKETESFVIEIVSKACGVFLWVRLVMRDLLRGVRDGDSIAQLMQKLTQLSPDLDNYLKRMIDSIEPQHRREASMMLQIACFEETRFITTRQSRLLQLSFVEEQALDFAINSSFDLSIYDPNNPISLNKLSFKIDSTLRKLQSRCMGLLECSRHRLSPLSGVSSSKIITTVDEVNLSDLGEVFHLEVDFLHRSVKDFLELPHIQEFLHFHTDGPLDVRRFLCNAWLVQFRSLSSISSTVKEAIHRSADLLPTLSVCGTTEWSSTLFSLMYHDLVKLAESRWAEHDQYSAWYILSSLRSWREECSSPLTLAIDFGLTSYVLANLTTISIRNKKGRPILDYILRPRFLGTLDLECCNRMPDIKMLEAALSRGADPNAKHEAQHVTVWETFLCLWARCSIHDWNYSAIGDEFMSRNVFTQALVMLLKAGACPVVAWSALAIDHPFERYDDISYGLTNSDPDDQVSDFDIYWPNTNPVAGENHKSKEFQLYLVSNLLSSHQLFANPAYHGFREELRLLEYNYLQKHELS